MEPPAGIEPATHPYHGTTRNRCADHRIPRSRPTVGAKVIGSPSVKLCVLFKPCADRRWSKPSSLPIDRSPGVHAILVMVAFDVVDQFVSPRLIQQRTDCYQQTKPFARLFGVTEQIPPYDYQASGLSSAHAARPELAI